MSAHISFKIKIHGLINKVPSYLFSQATMDSVGISLENSSAFISIMASSGGVNFIFALFYIYAAFKAQEVELLYALYMQVDL